MIIHPDHSSSIFAVPLQHFQRVLDGGSVSYQRSAEATVKVDDVTMDMSKKKMCLNLEENVTSGEIRIKGDQLCGMSGSDLVDMNNALCNYSMTINRIYRIHRIYLIGFFGMSNGRLAVNVLQSIDEVPFVQTRENTPFGPCWHRPLAPATGSPTSMSKSGFQVSRFGDAGPQPCHP